MKKKLRQKCIKNKQTNKKNPELYGKHTQNAYSVSQLLGRMTTWWLDSDSDSVYSPLITTSSTLTELQMAV